MIDKVLDRYFNNALIFDFLCVTLICFLNSSFSILTFTINTKDTNTDILSEIISTSISLAGFTLAALTIITSIRSNIVIKKRELTDEPLNMFFSLKNYKKLIQVFRGSIIELTFCYIVAYITWISLNNLENSHLFIINISLIYLISVSSVRSLIILFLTIKIT